MSTDNVFSPDSLESAAASEGFTPAQQAAADLRVAAEERGAEPAAQKTQAIKEAATEKIRAFREAATEQAATIRDVANERLQDSRIRAREMHQTAEDYIRTNPTKAVLTAAGVGFIIGLIVRR